MVDALIYTDGASRGNPGPAGAGAIIYTGGGTIKLKRYLGETTNNVAEYEALLMALRTMRRLGFHALRVLTDSNLMAAQVRGDYKVENLALRRLKKSVDSLKKDFDSFVILHIPRKQNTVADRLANEAIDEQTL